MARGVARYLGEARCTALVALLLLAGSGLPRSLAPLHAHRAAFRTAGVWIAEHSQPADAVIDPYNWASYYSGKMLQEKRPAGERTAGGGTRYVVLPGQGAEPQHRPLVARALRLASQGKEVFRTSACGRRGKSADVVVYAVPILGAE
jgi:hypothetical protein